MTHGKEAPLVIHPGLSRKIKRGPVVAGLKGRVQFERTAVNFRREQKQHATSCKLKMTGVRKEYGEHPTET